MASARANPSSRPDLSSRRDRGQRSSSKMRGSGRRDTLALTSDVPPSPHPENTFMSAPT